MARDFNQNRIANARLVSADIDKFGKTFAIQSPYNADGFSSVNVTVEQAPSDIKQYLEGDNSITVYPVPSNIDKLCKFALASFPKIEDLYLFKTSAIAVLEDDLSYLLDLNKIYVPSDLLSAYISAYTTLSSKFDTIVEDYTLTIPFVGDTTLTSEYVDSVIAMLSSAEKNAITKVVIPTDFTQESANDIAWGYNFSAIVNLGNNIWYGSTQYDFSVWTIEDITQDHILTASVVSASVNSIPSDKLSCITKVVIDSGFTLNENNCLYILQNTLTNLTTLEIKANISNLSIINLDNSIATGESSITHIIIRGNVTCVISTIGYTNRTVKHFETYASVSEGNGRNYSYDIGALELVEIHKESNTCFDCRNTSRLGNIPKIIYYNNTASSYVKGLDYDYWQYGGKLFLYFDEAFLPSRVNSYVFEKLYVKADLLISYINYQNALSNHTIDDFIGFLDYTDTVPTFSGYTDQWYSDEDCTTPIATTDFVSGTRYFVKLTAI